MKIMHVVGARPNFMKVSPIIREMAEHQEIEQTLVHTGQHYDEKMSQIFFDELGMCKPDIDLEVGSGSHAQQTARIMSAFEPVLLQDRPDLLIVPGDVNSTLACSLTASKLHIPIAHLEAGLRSFDRTMPEEINRLMTDVLSDILLTTSPEAEDNLVNEGIARKKIFFVGNTMIDTLLRLKKQAMTSDVLRRCGIPDGVYALVTLHRPSNVDDETVFRGIMNALKEIGEDIPIIFPVHPRTRGHIAKLGFHTSNTTDEKGIHLLQPVGYLDFMQLMMHAAIVMTDSGGIQEETSILNIPCITIRENTERPITVSKGTNQLVGTKPQRIITAAQKILKQAPPKNTQIDLWDGKAAGRIVSVILRWFRAL
ncbi:MAG: UDP-N-acetylglucosamine 2-epimerase (non-hydrolyzing) [Nitrospirota bacterium]|nr:UDP-N-acetylglucosamine 2-epimerase (non-hydrolyzing) [Nitrospirota bacterium]